MTMKTTTNDEHERCCCWNWCAAAGTGVLLPLLEQYVDDKNYGRTCLYLVSCCNYLPEPDDAAVLDAAHRIYMKVGKLHDALRVALHMNRRDTVEATFAACSDEAMKKQLSYLLARQVRPAARPPALPSAHWLSPVLLL